MSGFSAVSVETDLVGGNRKVFRFFFFDYSGDVNPTN
jgi:hypothetical protein